MSLEGGFVWRKNRCYKHFREVTLVTLVNIREIQQPYTGNGGFSHLIMQVQYYITG